MGYKESSIYDCGLLKLPKITNPSGNLTAMNSEINLPFKLERIYYLYDIPGGESRGGHAHKNLQQLIVAASGSFDIILNDGTNQKTFHLNRPYYGLHIVPGIWREIINFSSGAICLVLASDYYCESDYIRKFSNYLNLKNNFKL